ncbi:DJ-1/PfpI family protein [Aspergillus clavatus NRRL 1]|uniref:DJ-1/PfpI family protein n=1 Tax=Aspergillus clavatus (strain ATCC 1007 / CBS 513.65 / DSM 816 / NCTC 3887 / NRRL 1 / QM 1276 / 107) TaxID=344612 RepID=A1CN80_ASPCL|nr:DJ-1/PfpI family protein [Aspergillus clavatus NRRL 1]EAW07101.1 DJ-1/PfpI family protein [Aspergillus clavatus NRRL 1]
MPSALILIYPSVNTLDTNGPIGVLFQSGFSTTIAALDEFTTTQENVTIKRDLSLSEAKDRLAEYDVLIVPGTRPNHILPHVTSNGYLQGLLELISAFAKLGPKHPGPTGERVLFSVCTGSYLLAAAGVLAGTTATSHRLALGPLQQLCDEYTGRTPGSKRTEVVPEGSTGTVYYVDSGLNEARVRIITSGSITNGIDAALHLVMLRSGRPAAVEVAAFMGYAWREM